MAEAQINPDFGARFRAGFLLRRRDALGVLVDRARTRGDLPPLPRPATIADLVFGLIGYRVLATRDPIDESLKAVVQPVVELIKNFLAFSPDAADYLRLYLRPPVRPTDQRESPA